jgi:hypothetical protein
MATFTIHQRKLGKDKSDQINADSNSDNGEHLLPHGIGER